MDNSEHIRRIVSNYFRQYDRNTPSAQCEDIFTIFSSSMYSHNRKVCGHNGSVGFNENCALSSTSLSHEQPSTSTAKPFPGPGTSTAPDILDSEMPAHRYDFHSYDRMRLGQQQYEPCHACNGYYVPRYEDPYCSVCHAFLYPNMASSPVEVTSQVERSSDSDSGNDEPVDNNTYPRSRPHSVKYLFPSSSTDADSPSSSQGRSEISSVVPVSIDSLAEELQKLSIIPSGSSETTIKQLPPEVLMYMFRYFDEIALWSFGQVCTNWRAILFTCFKQNQWKNLFKNRWPLYPKAGYECVSVSDWYELYTAMMHSSCCQKCVRQMAAQALPPNWEENQWRKHRLKSELRAMRLDPLDGIQTVPLDENFCHWQATIHGPAGSPYEGGLFFLYIQVPASYPLYPPVVRFITKIYHPNISRHGDIGIDSIHHNWSLVFTLSKLLISIQSLLTDPYCDICMEPEIAQQYLNNRERFNELAQLWTFSYAMHDLRCT